MTQFFIKFAARHTRSIHHFHILQVLIPCHYLYCFLSNSSTIISFSSGAKEQVQYTIFPCGFKTSNADWINLLCLMLQMSISFKLLLFFLVSSFIIIPSQVQVHQVRPYQNLSLTFQYLHRGC